MAIYEISLEKNGKKFKRIDENRKYVWERIGTCSEMSSCD